jgi:hypothetical protein
MGQLQKRFFELAAELGFSLHPQPRFPWLTNRPDLQDPSNADLKQIFLALDGDLGSLAAKRERSLEPDGFLTQFNQILEFDEFQHFTKRRSRTLDLYPSAARLGFDKDKLKYLCETHFSIAESKGPAGYRAPKPEFPFQGGRHSQRAFFDACRDLLPAKYGLGPTIRVFETDIPSLQKGSDEQAKHEIKAAIESALERSRPC